MGSSIDWIDGEHRLDRTRIVGINRTHLMKDVYVPGGMWCKKRRWDSEE